MIAYFFLVVLFAANGEINGVGMSPVFEDVGSCHNARETFLARNPQTVQKPNIRYVRPCTAFDLRHLPRCIVPPIANPEARRRTPGRLG